MLNVFAHHKRKGRMVYVFSIVFIMNSYFVSLSLSMECTTCEHSYCPDLISERCFCRRTVVNKTEQRWNRYYGTYVEENVGVLHASADCFNFIADSDSIFGGDICPENPCLYVTFTGSIISTVSMNFFERAPHLQKIVLRSSGIQKLQVGAFGGLSELQELYLESNELTMIKDGCLNNLSVLKTLDFHSNKITMIEEDAFLGLTSLEYLDLSRNQLSSIPHKLLNPLVRLENLILSHNLLTVLDFKIEKLNRLETLYLNHNNIENIGECFEDSNVKSLFLQNNAISYLNDSCLSSSVSVLNLANNDIDHFNLLSDFGSLTMLNVSNNNISELPISALENMRNLLNLDLSQNSIHELKTGVFSMVRNIEYLNLSNVNLYKTDPHVLTPLNNLKILDISYNNLSYWDEDSFIHFDHFQKIFLDGNYFPCEIVSSLIKQSRIRNFSLVFNTNYAVENINGLACTSSNSSSQNAIESDTEISVLNSKISDDIKNEINKVAGVFDTKLEKHSEWEKTQLDILEKEILKKNEISLKSEIKGLNDSISSKFLSLEKEILKKNEISLKSEIKGLNDSISSEFLSFQKMLSQSMYSIKTNIFKNAFTFEPRSMDGVGNQDSHLNTSIVNLDKKLSNSIRQLSFFCMIGFSSLTGLFLFVKITSCICRSRRREGSFELAQEMPILTR